MSNTRHSFRIPVQRSWREEDPPTTTVGELSPDDCGGRVVIRSKEFLGTVCGTLLDVHPHPSLVHFTSIQLLGKKILTFRNDIEAIVVDELRPRETVLR